MENFINFSNMLAVGIAVVDKKGFIIHTNEANCNFLGYTKQELTGMHLKQFTHPADLENDLALHKKLLAGNLKSYSIDKRYIRKDGKIIWGHHVVSHISADNDLPQYTLVSCEDITEKKHIEEALRKSKESLQTIFDHSPVAIMQTDENGTITTCNRNAPALFGAPKEKLIGFFYKDIQNKKMRDAIAIALSGKPSHFEGEYHTVTGNVRTHMNANFSPSMAPDGSVAGVIGVFEDISERQALNEIKERYHVAFHTSPDSININKLDGTYVEINEGFTVLTGYTRQDVLGKSSLEINIWAEPADREKLVHALKKYGVVRSLISRFRLKDGSLKTGMMSANIITLDGEPHILSVTKDITELKQAEVALKESEEKYRKLFTNGIDAICIFDIKTLQLLDVNNAFEKLYGYSRAEALQLTVHDVSAEPEKSAAAIKKSTAEGATLIPRRRHKRKDGSILIVELSAGPFTWKGQEVMFSMIRDISEHIKAEDALMESERKFRHIISSTPMGVFLYRLETDGRLICTDANPAADTILGINCRQFIGKTIEEAFPSLVETEAPEHFRQAAKDGTPWQQEQLSYKDDLIEGAFQINAFQTEPGTMAVFFSDITQKRRMEMELQKIQKLESIGILAGGIAHDFNNILTAILGNISLAKMYANPGDKIFARLAETEKASVRAQELTQQLLTFSRGGAPVKKTASISELIKDTSTFILSGSKVQCTLNFADDLWPAMIDAGQTSQVIQNIVKNAEQAMPQGGIITIDAQNMTLGAGDQPPLTPGNYVKISIKDQGIGISENHLAKIFDPYFTTKLEGNGLGLAVAYSVIKNHGGQITVESRPNTGTTFTVILPASADVIQKKAEHVPFHGHGKILIMDDDEFILNVATKILQRLGFETETTTNGNDAVALFRDALAEGKPFRAVILDLTIPGGMGGEETIKQLRSIDPDIIAIVSSGYATDSIMANHASFGFDGVIRKPYDIEGFSNALRTCLS